MRQDREDFCHDLDESLAATTETHILTFACPTNSEKWYFQGGAILSFNFEGGEGSTSGSLSAFKKQTCVTTKDIGALQQYCKDEAKTFPRLDNKDMTWKGVVTLGRSLEAINDSLTTDVRFRHWLSNEVTRKEFNEGNLIVTMLQYMVTGNFAVYFRANLKSIRQTVVDFKSACLFLAQHCTTQRSVYAYNIYISREVPVGKYQTLLSEFSIAVTITPILDQLYKNTVTVIRQEEVPHKILQHLSPPQRDFIQKRMEDGATLTSGDRVTNGNITLDWIQAMCMQHEIKSGTKPSHAKVMAISQEILSNESTQTALRSMASAAMSGYTTQLPDHGESHELSESSQEDEEDAESPPNTTETVYKMAHGYMRDPKKNRRSPRNPNGHKKFSRPSSKSPRFHALNTNPGILKPAPSAERPCRICGSPEHWMSQCPQRFNRKSRDQNFHRSQNRLDRDIEKARTRRNFPEMQRLTMIKSWDLSDFAKVCEECDEHNVTPYASDTDNDETKSVGISEVEEDDDEDTLAPGETSASAVS